ncbi:uncharacterized protein BX664DRAFT_326376 [Halteromyces radiatus]|uniref:uncharacterized protein n=1 Tax=Halteromyces radiatus TaxID=101107 RepID=UPI00222107B1|nr:uncharacterized protein BX664DRAFT_326376 [Halteromyces radiatus]KAI8097442.1 hypothetical protein BX664DRAFT_326376 [Halteromyces radiatus]
MSITIESFGANGTTMQLDTDHSSSWLANIFQPYVMPFTGDGNDELVDDHLDWRFLGVCSLKSKTYGLMDVAFFQISSNSEDKTRMGTMIVDDSFTPTPSTTNPLISCIATGDTTSSSPNNSDTTESNHSDEYPRSNNCKRIIVMSSDTQAIKFSSHQAYYIFPSDAIVETVNDSAPYEVFCSFHVMVPNQQRQLGYVIDPSDHVSNNMSPLDNQRCYTNSPSSSLLLETMPDIKMEQTTSSVTIDGSLIIHLSISGLSKELYSNIKETVAGFETTYGKMIQLMKLHTEGVSHRQAELQILDGNHASRTKKVTSDLKTTKNKRKGKLISSWINEFTNFFFFI